LPAFLVACGDNGVGSIIPSVPSDQGALSLSASIPVAVINVVDNAFGASLEGGFRLDLALGAEASGPTSVTLGNFSLQTEAGEPLIEVLKAETSSVFPLQLSKGDERTVNFNVNEDGVDKAQLCAGKVRVVGSVQDSLSATTKPAQSALFALGCGSI
jgi:hypothetical protein